MIRWSLFVFLLVSDCDGGGESRRWQQGLIKGVVACRRALHKPSLGWISIPSILKVFDSLSPDHVVGLVTIASHDGLTNANGWWTARRHLLFYIFDRRDDACNLVWRLDAKPDQA